MVLGNDAISRQFNHEWGFLNSSALERKHLNAASLNLTLSGQFNGSEDSIPFVDLPPKGMILAFTAEHVFLRERLAGQILTRSSVGRLFVCCISGSAGWVDPGYQGQITLEFINHSNDVVRLIRGESYCQMVFHQVFGCTEPYQGKYGGPNQTASDMLSKGVEK